MGLFGWLKRLLLGQPPASQSRTAPLAPTSSGSGAVPSDRRAENRPANTDLSGLDAPQFAPISDAELKSGLGALGSPWQSPWFGRRDRIPPVSDPRTELIDRAMVGQGLITAEELSEIHRIGTVMDEIRPDLAQATEQATAAVLKSREEREARRCEKQAEAAQQRADRAAEVAKRRATDIVFLGRGVSGGLADRQSDAGKLEAAGLPLLSTPADVAIAMELSVPRLRWLAFHNPVASRTHYIRFSAPKKSGGMRELAAPHRELARCQRWILQNVLNRVPLHDAAHGFRHGRSTCTNAAPHVGSTVVVNADLADFFPTVTFPRVKGVFRELGYSPAVATIFALLTTESLRQTVEYGGQRWHVALGPRALPQGACTSPGLSNLVARRLDARLAGLAAKLGWRYTRYADDLTFSTAEDGQPIVGYLLARLRHIVAEEGFGLNAKKTRVQRRNQSQRVTGIVVNERPGVPRKTVRRLRAILHRARFEGLEAQNREGHPHFEEWLCGMLAYVEMVNPDQAEPLWTAYESLSDPAG